MIRKTLFILLLSFSCSFVMSGELDRTLVVVINHDSELAPLNAKELRKLYLGLKVKKNGEHLKPVQNYSDDVLHEVFLQKIMFMTSRTYQRQLKLRTIRKGIKPPVEFSSNKSIVELLMNNKHSVAYMWKAEAERISDIRVLQSF